MLSYCPHTNITANRRPPPEHDKPRAGHARARNGAAATPRPVSHPVSHPQGSPRPPRRRPRRPPDHMNGHVVSDRHPVLGSGYRIVDPPRSETLRRRSQTTPSPDPGPISRGKTAQRTAVGFNARRPPANSQDDFAWIGPRAADSPALTRSQSTQTERTSCSDKPPVLSRSPSAPPPATRRRRRRAEVPVLPRARGAFAPVAWSASARYSDSSSSEGSDAGSESEGSSFAAVAARNPAVEYPLSVILIGDSGTGKTCLVARLADNVFMEKYDVTVGIDFNIARLELPDGRPIRLQLWDTVGQEKYRAITSAYYRKAMGVVLVYDVTRRASLENIANVWRQEVEKYAEPDVPLMLVGNKMDLDDYRTITTRVGAKLAAEIGAIFYEVSAKEDRNIRSAFQAFALDIIENVYSKRNPCLSLSAVKLDIRNANAERTKTTCNC